MTLRKFLYWVTPFFCLPILAIGAIWQFVVHNFTIGQGYADDFAIWLAEAYDDEE